METVFRLIVGLGNPGDRYRDTRHNVGFSVVDELARRAAVSFAFDKKWDADVAQCGGRMLMKPQTFMNLSGESVGNYVRFFKIEPREVLVILDDVSLPAGALRIRPGGGTGGHNGLESILVHLGTESVPRLRLGIGESAQIPLDEFVLSRFAPDEIPRIQEAVLAAADAAEFANARGLEAAMNQYNQNRTNTP